MLESKSDETKSKTDEETSKQDYDFSLSEDIEPRLKYERLLNDLQGILEKGTVSCITLHPKFICLGTGWGQVHVLNHQGKLLRNDIISHSLAVNELSVDAKGDFIASCSDDGKAFVCGLHTQDNQMQINFGQCIKSIAVDPYYYEGGKCRRLVTGDNDRLVLHEKTFLSRVKSTVLLKGVGKVQNIKWKRRFIALACDAGVRVYDIEKATPLVLIKWNRADGALPENFPCCLSWKNNSTLLIGWVDTVRVCKIVNRTSATRDVLQFTVKAVSTLQIDYYISGICPLDSSQLVILAYEKEKDENNKSLQPKMYILQAEGTKYVEIDEQNLSLRGYQDCICNDYHLDCLVDKNRFIITSPKDVVIASIYDFDDRIEWLVDHCKFGEAMELVTTKESYLQRNSLPGVGKKYVEYLLKAGKFDKAAEICAELLGTDKKLWKIESEKLTKHHLSRTISWYRPWTPQYKLDPLIYDMVLKYKYLKKEPENFLKIIRVWTPDLYNVNSVTNAVKEYVKQPSASEFKNILLESLAILYTHSGQYNKALNKYLKLKHKDAFKLIEAHKLYNSASHKIKDLMELDSNKTISIFMNTDSIPIDQVISNLQHNRYYQYLYLDALCTRGFKNCECNKYHIQLLKLYADFAPHKLLPLLWSTNNYPVLEEALSICKEHNLYRETVYLLGLIGEPKEALQLLVNKIGDVEQAIDFCKERNDPDLWEELIDCSLTKPEFVTSLMEKISPWVDPYILVQRIRSGYKIPGLKSSLVKMLCDYKSQISVEESCANIIIPDCFDLLTRLAKVQQRGLTIDDEFICYVCQQKILTKSNVLVFFSCRHSFHKECLQSVDSSLECIICHLQKSEQILL